MLRNPFRGRLRAGCYRGVGRHDWDIRPQKGRTVSIYGNQQSDWLIVAMKRRMFSSQLKQSSWSEGAKGSRTFSNS